MSARSDAYISWSALAEPADPVASWLVAGLGPEAALAWVRTAGADPLAARIELAPHAPRGQVDAAVRASEKWVARLEVADADPHRERAAKAGARVITRDDPAWPSAFESLGALAPFALWVRGHGDLNQCWARSAAVVGARAATPYGEHMAASLSARMADDGWAVISGGAYGIDGAAHRSALACAAPSVAVMAGGVDRFYPAGHDTLLHGLLDHGAVVSEVPPGYAPHRARFLTRNRLIAAASVTVVVEAAARSGALSTARHAAALGRPVGAVPGPVTSASSMGCHVLIRQGEAVLVAEPDHVRELASPVGEVDVAAPRSQAGATAEFSTPHERAAFDGIGQRGGSVEQVAYRAGLTIQEAQVALGGLELGGAARRDGPVWRR